MKPKKRQKLCHNCEGEVDLDVIVCPYCAADLREEKPEQGRMVFSQPPSPLGPLNFQNSLYPASPREEELPPTAKEEALSSQQEERGTNAIFPTVLFTLGVQLLLLSFLMLLFSHKGIVTLRWEAKFWIFYFFAAIPMLIFGYRSLSKL